MEQLPVLALWTIDSGTTGTVNVATGNNAKTINIGTGNAGNNINIGTDDTVTDAITIGSSLDSVNVLGAVTANNFSSNGVAITGGIINGTTIVARHEQPDHSRLFLPMIRLLLTI